MYQKLSFAVNMKTPIFRANVHTDARLEQEGIDWRSSSGC
jgi:hypothetical protein